MRESKGTEGAGVFVIPLHQEDVSIARRRLITGRVQVFTRTHQDEHLVDELLACESVTIERTPVGRTLEHAPEVREEGDTLIIPVVEEVLVIGKRWLLREEVRVRRVRTTHRHRERVQLRRQEASITRDSRNTGTKQRAVRKAAAETKKQHR
jgi:uncharacterized protein (TIGR02271 family)